MSGLNEIEIDLLYGEKYKSYCVAFDKLSLVHRLPGMYSWHLRLSEDSDLKGFVRFFHQVTLNAKVEGNIRFSYTGKLTKDFHYDDFEGADLSVLRKALLCTNYPLYIGISSNLKSRLLTHKSQFLACLQSKPLVTEKDSTIDIDSDDESAFFGARLALLWRHTDLPSSNLFVKYIIPDCCEQCESDSCHKHCLTSTIQDLRSCEYLCNGLFNPVFGRR